MSYSYIKSVFPKFESSKIYDERIYNSLTSISNPSLSFNPSAINEKLQTYTENLPTTTPTPTSTTTSTPSTSTIPSNDNLRFYNKPLPEQFVQLNESTTNNSSNNQSNGQSSQSNSQSNISTEILNCDMYCNHILSCPKCSSILSKQLGITNDKARIQEMMELGSYLIFGIFILLLLESIRKK